MLTKYRQLINFKKSHLILITQLLLSLGWPLFDGTFGGLDFMPVDTLGEYGNFLLDVRYRYVVRYRLVVPATLSGSMLIERLVWIIVITVYQKELE